MKKNVNSVLIGKRVSRKEFILPFVLLSILGVMTRRGVYFILNNYFRISESIGLMLAFIIYIGIVFLLLPVTINAERILFTDEYICYYHTKGYLNKFKQLFLIMFNGDEIPSIRVKTSEVLKIHLSYLKYLGPRGLIGYRLKMTFFLKDGKSFYLLPLSVGQMENGDYERVFDLLEKNEIKIVDKLKLRPYLSQNSSDFQKYVSSIEKNKNI